MKTKRLLILLISLLVLTIGAGILVYIIFFTTIFMSDKEKVMLAFSKTLGGESIIAELSGNGSIKNDDIYSPSVLNSTAFKNAARQIKSGKYESDFEISLDNIKMDGKKIYTDYYGLGYEVRNQLNKPDKQLYSKLFLRYNGLKLIDFETFVSDNELSFAEDSLLDGYITVNTETLGKDLLNTGWIDSYTKGDKEKQEEIRAISFNCFDYINNSINTPYDRLLKDGDYFIPPVLNLYNNISVSKTDTTGSADIGDKQIKTRMYSIYISKESCAQFLNDIKPYVKDYYNDYIKNQSSYLAGYRPAYTDTDFDYEKEIDNIFEELIENTEDITIYAFLDRKNRLIALSYDSQFEYENNNYDVSISAKFCGAPYLMDNTTIIFNISNEINSYNVELNWTAIETDNINNGNLNVTGTGNNKTLYTFEAQSTFNEENGDYTLKADLSTKDKESIIITSEGSVDIKKQCATLIFDSLNLEYKDLYEDYSAELSGEYEISALSEEVKTVTGTKYEILKLNETQLLKIMQEIQTNADKSPIYSMLKDL